MKTFAEMASPDIQNILDVLGNTSAPQPASEKYTLFAPINDAFDALQQLLVGNISQDRAEIDRVSGSAQLTVLLSPSSWAPP